MHYEEIHNLISSRSFTLIKSQRMKQAGHVEQTGKDRNAYRFSVGKT